MIEAFKTLRELSNLQKADWTQITGSDGLRPSTRSNMNVEEGREDNQPCELGRERAHRVQTYIITSSDSGSDEP